MNLGRRGAARPAALRRRTGSILAVTAALTAAVVAAALVPGTSGAFTAAVTNTQNSALTKSVFTCADRFAATTANANAYFEWQLGEPATTSTAADSSAAANSGLYQSGHGLDTASPMACPNDTSRAASTFDGASQYLTASAAVGTSPTSFSLVVWFKTTVQSGRIIGLSTAQTGSSGVYDRQIYLNGSGQLLFGSYGTNYQIITSAAGVNYADGTWHQVVATMTNGATNTGMFLYVDGVRSASNSSYTTAEADTGYWRVGYCPMGANWNGGSNSYFTGSIRFAAAYKYVLTAAEVSAQWSIGRPS